MVHKCTKIVNLFLMGSLGTQSLKEFKISNILNLKNTDSRKHLEAREMHMTMLNHLIIIRTVPDKSHYPQVRNQ